MTGFNLPPGCTTAMIDALCEEGPCAVCGNSVEDCICPECPVCTAMGDPACYSAGPDDPGHDMKLSREQAVSRQKARIREMQVRLAEEGQVLDYLENGGEFDPNLWSHPGIPY